MEPLKIKSKHNPTLSLVDTPLFHARPVDPLLSAQISYQRAKAIGLAYDLSVTDVMNLTDKFWEMHSDPIFTQDGAAATLLTIHYNLAAGTLTQYLPERDDLHSLLQDILQWKKNGQFCLTELGHGLDILNLQTTAELLPDGGFCLNTPSPEAAKFMPPTVPAGIPCVAVVWARLIVNSEDHGIKPFVVPLNDGYVMYEGITARLLPHRAGARAVNHSLTYFNNVRLPHDALLGTLDAPMLPRMEFLVSIWRVAVGTLALGITAGAMMPMYATIGARYSMRRMVHGPDGKKLPILQFRTQQIPVLTTIAQAFVMKGFTTWAVKMFRDLDLDLRVRHGIATCMKAVAVQHSQIANLAISERCGAQGLMGYNQLAPLHNEIRGIAIAEGDILVLSIRLATELILGRYELPESTNPDSLLSRHEKGLISEAQSMLKALPHHRSPQFDQLILPRCQLIIEAIGHRMAYDAAVAAGVRSCLLDLYVSSVLMLDPAWYVEKEGITRQAQVEARDRAVAATLPKLEELVRELDVESFVIAPIVSDNAWNEFLLSLQSYDSRGNQGEVFHLKNEFRL